MLRFARVQLGIAALAMSSIVGCSTSGSLNLAGNDNGSDGQRTQLAAYSASTHYPENAQAMSDLQIATLVNQDKGTVRIFNFTNKPITDVDVWVNNSFIRKVAAIPAYGSVTLPMTTFFDSTGRDLKMSNTTVRTVQLGWRGENKLYNALGPAFE